MSNQLYALLYRLRFTPRWSGSYCIHTEDVAQHSHFVSLIAHALCLIKKNIYNEDVNVEKVITLALYHDSSDAILTHVIAPVKRHESVKTSFQKLKGIANNEITRMVPEKMVSEYLNLSRCRREFHKHCRYG